MTSNTDLITLEDVIDVTREITLQQPDELNPVDEYGRCLYTDPAQPHKHCLGGMILLRLGCELPSELSTAVCTPDKFRFAGYESVLTPGAALDFVRKVQSRADAGYRRHDRSSPKDRRLPWREAFEQVLSETEGV